MGCERSELPRAVLSSGLRGHPAPRTAGPARSEVRWGTDSSVMMKSRHSARLGEHLLQLCACTPVSGASAEGGCGQARALLHQGRAAPLPSSSLLRSTQWGNRALLTGGGRGGLQSCCRFWRTAWTETTRFKLFAVAFNGDGHLLVLSGKPPKLPTGLRFFSHYLLHEHTVWDSPSSDLMRCPLPSPCSAWCQTDLNPLTCLPSPGCLHSSLPPIRSQGHRALCFHTAGAGTARGPKAGYVPASQPSGSDPFRTCVQPALFSPRSLQGYVFIKASCICDILTQMGYNKFHLDKQCLFCVINFAFSCLC